MKAGPSGRTTASGAPGTPGGSGPAELADLDDLDAGLAELRAAVAARGADLLDLDGSPGRGLLDPTGLTGTTRARVGAILADIAGLWSAYAALREVLAQSGRLRDQLGGPGERAWWARPDQPGRRAHAQAELTALLRGASIRTATGAVRPDDLARRLDVELRAVRASTLATLAAWNRRLAAAADTARALTELDRLAVPLGVSRDDPALGTARRLGGELAALVATDPLGLDDVTSARAEAAIEAARRILTDLARRRDGLAAELAAATELCRGIGDGQDGPQLRQWLDRLMTQAEAGRWKEASHGLDRWHRAATAALGATPALAWSDRAGTDRAGTPLAPTDGTTPVVTAAEVAMVAARTDAARRRAHLRGLLGAWQAKANALGRATDPELAGLAAGAVRRLRDAPPAWATDLAGRQSELAAEQAELAVAARLVEAYGARLAGRTTTEAARPAHHGANPDRRPDGGR